MSDKLVVFDLDETLIACDSCVEWHEFLVERGVISGPGFLDEDKRLMSLYAEGTLDMQVYINHSMAPLAGMPCNKIEVMAEECARTRILPKVYPAAKKLLRELKQNGCETIIISATQGFIVKEVAKLVGIDTAMGIELAVKNGSYTSQMVGIPTYRTGKVKRLESWLGECGDQYESIEFYTDSINDLPLCEHVDTVHVVNPCKKLKAVAGSRLWPVHNWVL